MHLTHSGYVDWLEHVNGHADTRQEILTKHKPLVATFLQTNFDTFFTKYNSMLIQSESYVTKRQSIKLLGEILLDRANYNVMTQYVDSGEHLKIIMKLLRDDRKMINYEGFHVFKVSVDGRGCARVCVLTNAGVRCQPE
jgi:calcium binding protein 39